VADLESPSSPDELYRYRGDEVLLARPVFQGDVFENVAIPGFDDGPGLAIVLTHACTMRGPGGMLKDRLLVGRVTVSDSPKRWRGDFAFMPLPELTPGEGSANWCVSLEDVGALRAGLLDVNRRIACLSDRGVVLLQQRQAHHFTRYVVETSVLYEQTGPALLEAELMEDWLDAHLRDVAERDWTAAHEAQTRAFDEYFAQYRQAAKEPSRWSSIRSAVRTELASRTET